MEDSRGIDETHACWKREARTSHGVLESSLRVANPLGVKSPSQNSPVMGKQVFPSYFPHPCQSFLLLSPDSVPLVKARSSNSSSVALSSSSLSSLAKSRSKAKSRKHPKSRALPHPVKTFPKHFVRRKRVKEGLKIKVKFSPLSPLSFLLFKIAVLSFGSLLSLECILLLEVIESAFNEERGMIDLPDGLIHFRMNIVELLVDICQILRSSRFMEKLFFSGWTNGNVPIPWKEVESKLFALNVVAEVVLQEGQSFDFVVITQLVTMLAARPSNEIKGVMCLVCWFIDHWQKLLDLTLGQFLLFTQMPDPCYQADLLRLK
ncbi:transportin-3 isoform X2 [Cucumis melo var. makuwa]|uniref:Transportin-3 isoform X2 n=1 Tax=Cucumis melo var. makuwa TaxID=1194695 RepID=A0A5D3DYJ4_CUCMM|nr:transportin-3 isoform X2 [Cucumis melo var. makuwa]